MVDKESPLTQRSYHVVTKFGNYFFRVRNPSSAKAFLSMATALEKQALQIWEKSDILLQAADKLIYIAEHEGYLLRS
jgi:hypothetical protein